jgi:hypothetical protein
MTHHPHLHMIVPGGGLSPDGTLWIAAKPSFFLPVLVLSKLFRRLMLEKLATAHAADKLTFFGAHAHLAGTQAFAALLAPLRKTKWFVYAKRPFAGPKAVLAYLSRYTHRVAIANSRLIKANATNVTFKVKNYRVEGRARYTTMTLETSEFIRRFLIHVLPKGFHRIRHYGLFAGGTKAECIATARKLLSMPAPAISADTGGAADHDPTHDADTLTPPCPAAAAACASSRYSSAARHHATGHRRARSSSGSIPHDQAERPPKSRAHAGRSIGRHWTSTSPPRPTPPNPPAPAASASAARAFNHGADVMLHGEHCIRGASNTNRSGRSGRSSRIPIARAAPSGPHLSRVPSLEAFGRRPQCVRLRR